MMTVVAAQKLADDYAAKWSEPPIGKLYRKIEDSERRIAKLDAQTRDESLPDYEFEYAYRELRRERCAINRRRKAIRRIDTALGHDVAGLRPIEGRVLWGR